MFWLEGSENRPLWRGSEKAGCMTASEQMYFLGAPLAHVLHYEGELRDDRLRRAVNLRHARRIMA